MMEVMASQMSAILLGHSGENAAVRVAFDLTAFQKAFPGGQPLLLVRRYADTTAYPAPLTVEGQTAYWTVGAADTARAGYGQCELQWYLEDGTLAKSDLFDFLVLGTLKTDAVPPDAPSRRWFEAIRRQLGDLSKLTTQARENLVAAINEAAKTGSGSVGSVALRVSDGYIQFQNGDKWENLIEKSELTGTNGEKGEPGENGVTPTIGANGNWYIGSEDTGKPSRGASGASASDTQVSSAVDTWLTEHPEATTTVQDGSVSAQKLAGYSTECRDIPWELFLDGYKTIAANTQEDADCAVYAVKFEAGKTYCLLQIPYPVNTNEFVTDPDVSNFGWYRSYSALPDVAANLAAGRDRLYGQMSLGLINKIMTNAVSDGYIEPAITGQTLAGVPDYFTVKQDWYLLRASVKPDAGKRINNYFVAEVPAGMSDIGATNGEKWGVYKKDLGNGYASDRGYLQQIFVSKTANAENERAYAAMSRDVPRDRTLSIQFIGDSITYAASNAGLQNAFRKYVPMNLRAETMALCQSGASVTTGSGSYDWNGKQNTNAAYDAAMSGYSGLAQKLAEYKTNLSLKMWADAVDIVVVELGTNDHWEQATLGSPTDLTEDTNFYGAVEKTLTLLEDTFPNAQIMWLLPFKNQNWKTSTVKMVDYLIALKILCQMHTRCWVLDLFDKWFLNYDDADVRSKFFRDSVHITGDAHKCVAESMIDKIRQIISVCGLRQIETVRVTNANDSVYGSANA